MSVDIGGIAPFLINGEDGISVTSAAVGLDGHLRISLSDSTTVDAGHVAPVSQLAAAPDQIASGAITRSATGAATAFAVAWPDGAAGDFAGTESTAFPGAIDSYTVTHVLAGVTTTYTQPTLTRDSSGAVTNRPSMTVS